jgi:hypothetical protein
MVGGGGAAHGWVGGGAAGGPVGGGTWTSAARHVVATMGGKRLASERWWRQLAAATAGWARVVHGCGQKWGWAKWCAGWTWAG